ncbi:Ig-like domain-containing protein, partial [Oceanisphaera sp.]|uniref:Ig-like domain-containing protein n=1 Tax=Oceanisphaera sp. TaxID=1929979 RepID=UPI003A903261
LSGNAPLAGKDSANYAIDTTEPVVSRVTLSDSALKVGDTATLTIVFSEAVKDFDNSDVTLANGTLSAVTSSDGGITWTGTFTPSDNIEAAENVISVGTTFTDLAGNAPLAGKDSANYVIDTKAPSVSISSSAAALKAGETATLTFTFSEAPTDFSADDVSVDSGALSAFTVTGDPRVYTANYTPAVDTEDATMAVSVGSGYSDEAGNTGTGNSLQLEVDTQAPTVAITSSAAALKAGETATLTFTFSEAPTDFSADDVSVDSGALSAFTVTGDPRVYTATYTPAVDTENATMAVSVGTSYSDAAGNTGTGNSLQLEVDTKAPTLTSSSPADDATNVAVDSDITLTFNEDIALGTGNIVITDGTHTITIDVANHGGQLSVAGKELTINPTVDLANHGATYNVQVAPGAVTDAAGNGYAGITDETTLDFETAPINVVFDLTSGKSSSGGDSERNFEAGQKYVIYIKVHSTSEALTWDGTEQWNGATHLGADDKIVLTGNGAEVGGKLNNSVINHELAANSVAWRSSQHQAFAIHNDGRVERYFGGETGQVISVSALWTGNWGVRPNSNVTLGQAYMTALPTSIALPV